MAPNVRTYHVLAAISIPTIAAIFFTFLYFRKKKILRDSNNQITGDTQPTLKITSDDLTPPVVLNKETENYSKVVNAIKKAVRDLETAAPIEEIANEVDDYESNSVVLIQTTESHKEEDKNNISSSIIDLANYHQEEEEAATTMLSQVTTDYDNQLTDYSDKLSDVQVVNMTEVIHNMDTSNDEEQTRIDDDFYHRNVYASSNNFNRQLVVLTESDKLEELPDDDATEQRKTLMNKCRFVENHNDDVGHVVLSNNDHLSVNAENTITTTISEASSSSSSMVVDECLENLIALNLNDIDSSINNNIVDTTSNNTKTEKELLIDADIAACASSVKAAPLPINENTNDADLVCIKVDVNHNLEICNGNSKSDSDSDQSMISSDAIIEDVKDAADKNGIMKHDGGGNGDDYNLKINNDNSKNSVVGIKIETNSKKFSSSKNLGYNKTRTFSVPSNAKRILNSSNVTAVRGVNNCDHSFNNENITNKHTAIRKSCDSNERDSANHSPVEGIIFEPHNSHHHFSDIHSEGSSDSGKGCSEGAVTPTVNSPPGGSSESGDNVLAVFQFVIPQEYVGKLIGRRGQFINHVKMSSNTCVYIKKHPFSLTNKVCAIEGTQPEINAAMELVRSRFPEHQYPDLTLEEFPLLALPDSYPFRSDYCQQLELVECVNNDVIISSLISAGHMFLQQPMHPTYQSLMSLNILMNTVYVDPDTPGVEKPSVDTIVAAPAVDGWYRAQIVSVNEEAELCDVKFLDYGGYLTLSFSSLRAIRYDFLNLPFQAVECHLANVAPIDGVWSEEAKSIVEGLTYGQVLRAQVCDYSENGIPLILLYAIVGSQVILINQELVAKRCACVTMPPSVDTMTFSNNSNNNNTLLQHENQLKDVSI